MWIDDLVIRECNLSHFTNIFIPQQPMVVLGKSNKPDIECRLNHCQIDGVEIKQRYGGGGTVVLHQGCLVVSSGLWLDHPFRNDLYFKLINLAVIDTIRLISESIPSISQQGFSDLTIGGRKIVGTSLFRSKNYLLYQASLLVDARVELITRYLKHPSKEPDYRQGKSHMDFLTDLRTFDNSITPSSVEKVFQSYYRSKLKARLGDHLRPPVQGHIKHLLHRSKRAST